MMRFKHSEHVKALEVDIDQQLVVLQKSGHPADVAHAGALTQALQLLRIEMLLEYIAWCLKPADSDAHWEDE
jgi:hypothetical protein